MEENLKVPAVLRKMEVGEEIEYPAEKLRSVRTTASDYGFITGRKFKVIKDWEKRKVIVRRMS